MTIFANIWPSGAIPTDGSPGQIQRPLIAGCAQEHLGIAGSLKYMSSPPKSFLRISVRHELFLSTPHLLRWATTLLLAAASHDAIHVGEIDMAAASDPEILFFGQSSERVIPRSSGASLPKGSISILGARRFDAATAMSAMSSGKFSAPSNSWKIRSRARHFTSAMKWPTFTPGPTGFVRLSPDARLQRFPDYCCA